MAAPRIHLDPAAFHPWKIQALTHSLAGHPLLELGALIELGKRQQERRLVRTHTADATAGTSFGDAPKLHTSTTSSCRSAARSGCMRGTRSIAMPSTSPHLVENGDEPSITVSFTFYTDATRRRELLYRGNARRRQLGIEPTPVDASPERDRVKHTVLAPVRADVTIGSIVRAST